MEKSGSQPTSVQALEFLRGRYLERCKANPSYSLSAYARDLGISSSFLSRLMSGKRPVTVSLAMQIASLLGVSSRKAEEWAAEIIAKAPKSAKISKKVRANIQNRPPTKPVLNYELERFQVISRWFHLAILNLTYLKDFRPNASWIAKRLGLTTIEVDDAVQRLFSLGLLEEKAGTWVCTESTFFVNTQKSELSVREFHREMSDKAKESLLDTSDAAFAQRYISGVTLTFDHAKIANLTNRIREFQEEIIRLAGSQPTGSSEVYHLNLQLFPLTKQIGT